jgi:hypothetical protein
VTLIVDSQSVKAAETVSKTTRGFDEAKRINGRKRRLAVDTLGLLVMITLTPADTTDRDAACELLWRLGVMQPQFTYIWTDSAYVGQLTNWSDHFVVLPRRWKSNRLPLPSEAHLTWALTTLMTRRPPRKAPGRTGRRRPNPPLAEDLSGGHEPIMRGSFT